MERQDNENRYSGGRHHDHDTILRQPGGPPDPDNVPAGEMEDHRGVRHRPRTTRRDAERPPSKFFLCMATQRVFTILSRTAVQGNQQVQPYALGAVDFHDTGPIWFIATVDNDIFTIHDFDDQNTQTWVRTQTTHHRQALIGSVFAEIDVVGMAFDDDQMASIEDLASIAVSSRLVIAHGLPPVLVLVELIEFFPHHRVLLPDGSEIHIRKFQIALLDAPNVPTYNDIAAPVRATCETWLNAFIIANAPVPVAPAARAPKIRALPAAPPAPLAGPKLAAPPPNNAHKVPPAPPAPPPVPKQAAPPPNNLHKGPPGTAIQAQGRTSRPVQIKYTYLGEQRQADGIFIDESHVRWSDGSTTPFPPQWPGTVETELHIGQPTGQRFRPPGHLEANTFDVFNADSYLPFLENDTVETLMNSINQALLAEPDGRFVSESLRTAGARRLLKKYLQSPAAEDADPEDPDTLGDLRELHLNFIAAWAEQQGLNERAIVEFVQKKTSSRTNFVRQAIADQRLLGRRNRGGSRRGGRNGGRGGGGRGGGRSFGGCYTCGGNHFQRDCHQGGKPDDTQDGTAVPDGTLAPRGGGRSQGFRGGRGSGRRGHS